LIKDNNFKELLEGKSVKLTNPRLRLLLIEKFGARCMGGPTEDTKDCRWDKINPTTGKCPIELEHIDGNSENNVLSNLKLICPSCHSLTSTYKNLNKGKGRHKRRERYKEGKSY
jgi:5-methylcytosine-specific restriction endonuclease McrA